MHSKQTNNRNQKHMHSLSLGCHAQPTAHEDTFPVVVVAVVVPPQVGSSSDAIHIRHIQHHHQQQKHRSFGSEQCERTGTSSWLGSVLPPRPPADVPSKAQEQARRLLPVASVVSSFDRVPAVAHCSLFDPRSLGVSSFSHTCRSLVLLHCSHHHHHHFMAVRSP
jgi:hypothetical protein